MGNSSETSGTTRFAASTSVIELTGKIMVVAIILLFFIIFFVFCIHLYAKWFWYRRQETTTAAATRRRRRLDFAAGHQEITLVSPLRQGLDPLVLKTIPLLVFDSKEVKDGLECAVCLCEVSDGEKIRFLPKCNHGFHVDCIDMWFQSHSTCPLCRNPVSNQDQSDCNGSETPLETVIHVPMVENSTLGVRFYLAEGSNFPTNVLCWGNESQISIFGHCNVDEDNHHHHHQVSGVAEPSSSSSLSVGSTSNRGDAIVAVDIPRQINDDEEQKLAMPTRLRSLKRLLSGNRRVNPSSVGNSDLEQS